MRQTYTNERRYTMSTETAITTQRHEEAAAALNAAGRKMYGLTWESGRAHLITVFTDGRTSKVAGLTADEIDLLVDAMSQPGFSIANYVNPARNYGLIYTEDGRVPFLKLRY